MAKKMASAVFFLFIARFLFRDYIVIDVGADNECVDIVIVCNVYTLIPKTNHEAKNATPFFPQELKALQPSDNLAMYVQLLEGEAIDHQSIDVSFILVEFAFPLLVRDARNTTQQDGFKLFVME